MRKIDPALAGISPAKPSPVYDTYWRFAAERQKIFFRRLHGWPQPWTDDAILSSHKFTNAYRAADRVSQFLIRHVIYSGDQDPTEVFFRIMLFKLFNRIDTWRLLEKNFGEIRWSTYAFPAYDRVLSRARERGNRIYSGAYIMPSGRSSFGCGLKHRNHLRLIEAMIAGRVPAKLTKCKSMREAFELLRSYPSLGDFLAYQYTIDLNYSELTDFSEMDFVVPGPGAREGIRKCFTNLGGLSEVEVIRLMVERQEHEFARLGLAFQTLWGRRLHLVDCQNLFCEVAKYARVAHPTIRSQGDRIRIKQKFRPSPEPIDYWFPPKWGINDCVAETLRARRASGSALCAGLFDTEGAGKLTLASLDQQASKSSMDGAD